MQEEFHTPLTTPQSTSAVNLWHQQDTEDAFRPSLLLRPRAPIQKQHALNQEDTDEGVVDVPPYPLPPRTIGAFVYNIMLLPFIQGLAQGLGTAAALWLLRRMGTWSR
jgi:hypothetical protein